MMRSRNAACGVIALAVITLVTALASCSRQESAPTGSGAGMSRASVPHAELAMSAPSSGGIVASQTASAPRSLVRTLQLQLVTKDVTGTLARAETIAVSRGGFVASSNLEERNGAPYGNATLRVPSSRLDEAATAMRLLGSRVLRESRRTEDVTQQVVDFDARLRTLRATETQLLVLLGESRARDRKVADVMAIYRELTEIRSQIESLAAQLKLLTEQVDLSTIELELSPDEASLPMAGQRWRPLDTLRMSGRMLLTSLRALGNIAIFCVIVVLPIGLIVGVVALAVLRLIRRSRLRKTP